MPTTLSHEQLLDEAERIYRALGILPLYLATDLIEAGFNLDRLEQEWDATYAEQL